MFVHASAIVAILTREADSDFLTERLDSATAPMTSPLAIFEAVAGICRKCQSSVAAAETDVSQFLEAARIRSVEIAEADLAEALAAYARCGKGRGHPTQLNLGDCFAYAAAKIHDIPLLFKGEDFAKPDIMPAGDNALKPTAIYRGQSNRIPHI